MEKVVELNNATDDVYVLILLESRFIRFIYILNDTIRIIEINREQYAFNLVSYRKRRYKRRSDNMIWGYRLNCLVHTFSLKLRNGCGRNMYEDRS